MSIVNRMHVAVAEILSQLLGDVGDVGDVGVSHCWLCVQLDLHGVSIFLDHFFQNIAHTSNTVVTIKATTGARKTVVSNIYVEK